MKRPEPAMVPDLSHPFAAPAFRRCGRFMFCLTVAGALLAAPALAAEPRVGTVFPLAEIPLVTQAAGRVERLPVQEGQRVRRGQLILAIDRTRQLGEIKLLETQIAHKAALRLEEINLSAAKQDLARDEALAQDKTVTPKTVDDSRNRVRLATERVSIERGRLEEQRQLLAIRKLELEDYVVHAPADGFLSAVTLHANQIVGDGARVGEFLQVDQVVVETFVSLAEARKLAAGGRAAIRTEDGHSASGRIKSLGQKVDPVSASVKVKILVPNGALRFRPGMLVRVSL